VPELPWIQVQAPAEGHVDEVRRALHAQAGELETMALALGGRVVPVIDEGPARRYATERGLQMTSTLALLISLHRRGMVTRTVEEDLDLLIAGGMYFTEDLKAWTVEQARVSRPPGEEEGDVLGR
jgi:predicted nucleic acid-binding protein